MLTTAEIRWFYVFIGCTQRHEYIITKINTGDPALESFLFSLGCYSGEPITVVSRKKNSCTVSIKDGRYNIDSELAGAIMI